jgi:hypothetical protein
MDWLVLRNNWIAAAEVVSLVVLLTLIWKIAGCFLSGRRKAEAAEDSTSAPREELPREHHESPTASEIIATIDHANPSLKDDVRDIYVGRGVRWTLRLSSMCKMASGREACSNFTMFMLSGTQLKAVSVCFDVDIDAHPFLKTARVNEMFAVEGIIKDFPLANVVRLEDIRGIQKAAGERPVNPPASSAHTAGS